MDLRPLFRHTWQNAVALGISAAFGLLARLSATSVLANQLFARSLPVMMVAFLFGVPFAMGYLAVTARFEIERESGHPQPGVAYWICFPWIAALFACMLAALFAWEGWICLLFAAPALLLSASLGGITAGLSQRRRFRPAQLSAVALLPVLLTFLEARLPDPASLRTVETDIRIHASNAAVWQNVIRVRAIQPEELPASWVQRVGFPKPVEATLSHEGIGGVREASFTGGLLFTETIDSWNPLHQISFSIHADADQIPATTLDEHVKVGGPYFDVLEGEYRLEPQPDGTVLLRLSSHERVSTHFNAYAGLWTDAVMRSIQRSILVVIKHRAEAEHRI